MHQAPHSAGAKDQARETRRQLLGRLQHALMICALALLGMWGGATVAPRVMSALADRGFDRDEPGGALTGSAPLTPKNSTTTSGREAMSDRLAGGRAVEARADAAAGRVLGRISIPQLEVEADIREGLGRTTLLLAVGHVPGTGFPGEAGNVGLAGHRDTFFRKLKDVKEGHRIEIQTADGRFFYRVTETLIVSPAETRILAASAEPTLTLVTCYPFYWVGHAPRRFIVRAVLLRTQRETPPNDPPEAAAAPGASPALRQGVGI